MTTPINRHQPARAIRSRIALPGVAPANALLLMSDETRLSEWMSEASQPRGGELIELTVDPTAGGVVRIIERLGGRLFTHTGVVTASDEQSISVNVMCDMGPVHLVSVGIDATVRSDGAGGSILEIRQTLLAREHELLNAAQLWWAAAAQSLRRVAALTAAAG